MIDFHRHLDLYSEPSNITGQKVARNMYVLSVTTTPSAWCGTSALPPRNSKIRTVLGLHPQLAHQRIGELPLFDRYLSQTRYVGEIGLDGSKDCKPYWKEQLSVFEHILSSCSNEGGKIMSINSQRAATPVVDLLTTHPQAGVAILHWFTGSKGELKRAIELGCWFSVGPTMLQSRKSQEIINLIPKDRILTESDGPFAKVAKRMAMPWDAGLAVKGIADIWSMPVDEVDHLLHSNLRNLVSK